MNKQGVCEIVRGEGPQWFERICEKAATMRYPAMGGGWMHLCAEHGKKHARLVDEFGERWNGSKWAKPPSPDQV